MFKKFRRFLYNNFRYLGEPPWDTGVSPPELINYLQSAPSGRALDAGCGTGTNLLTMAKYGWEVNGVDNALLAVLEARSKLKESRVTGRVILRDVTSDLRFEDPFDLVLDIGCYHSLGQQGRKDYRENLRHWLKPGGTYLIYAHRRTSPDDSHGIREEDLRVLSGFLEIQWRKDNDERRPDGGGGLPATWAKFNRTKKS